jgi:hypothetical protein
MAIALRRLCRSIRVVLVDLSFGESTSATENHRVEHLVALRAIHAATVTAQVLENCDADLEASEVCSEQNYAFAIGHGGIEMFLPFDVNDFLELCQRRMPADTHLGK